MPQQQNSWDIVSPPQVADYSLLGSSNSLFGRPPLSRPSRPKTPAEAPEDTDQQSSASPSLFGRFFHAIGFESRLTVGGDDSSDQNRLSKHGISTPLELITYTGDDP
jgi:hypothetical protein